MQFIYGMFTGLSIAILLIVGQVWVERKWAFLSGMVHGNPEVPRAKAATGSSGWFFKEKGLVIEPKSDEEYEASQVIAENDKKGEPTKIEDIL